MDTNNSGEDVEAQEAEAADTPDSRDAGGDQPDTFDRAYVEKLRKESAKYRSQVKELEPLAAKARELEESKKSDLEKAQERIAQLEAAAQAAQAQAVRAKVASATGVPAELLPEGGDEDSLTAAAQALVSWAKKQAPEKKAIPESNAAGHQVPMSDKDAVARQILGI